MEGAEDRCAIIIRGKVRPRLHTWVDLSGNFEEHSACESECQIAKNGRDALELRVPIVQNTSAEGTAIFCDGLVRADQLVNLRRLRIVEEDGREVRRQFTCCSEVRREETKERALILLIANYEGDLCVLARCNKELGRLSDSGTVRARQVRQIHGEVTQDSRNRVGSLEELVVGYLPKASKRVGGTGATSSLDDLKLISKGSFEREVSLTVS